MIEVMRATEPWQQTGAYYVRIQAMARKHHITLRAEFDEHDGAGTRYIVLLDDDFPVATCRLYPVSESDIMIGRVVVLEEYRGKGLGTLVMREAEKWACELGFRTAVLESRINAVGFYEKAGYCVTAQEHIPGPTFECIRMEKDIKKDS